MSSIKDRADAFEAKFAHDAEMAFKAAARRNKMLAQWAGGLLQKAEDEIDAYISDVIKSDFEEAGDEDVLRKLASDLGDLVDEAEIRKHIDAFMVQARAELMHEHDSSSS